MENLEEILFDPLVGRLVATALGIVIIRVFVGLIQRWLGGRIHDTTTRFRVRKFISLGGYVLVGILITVTFSDRLGNLTVAFGVAGAGVAFALQELIASIAGWFAVSLGGFYGLGDRVQLGGIKGDVIDIGVLRTTVMEMGEWVRADQYTGRIVRIANSFVFKEPVFNYTADFPFLWDEITVPVRYGSDYQMARKILADAATQVVGDYAAEAKEIWGEMVRKYAIEEATVDAMVTVVANDNWVEMNVRYVVDHKRRRTTKDAISMAILEAVEASNGAVKLASATFELVGAPALEVCVSDAGAAKT